MTQNDNKQSGSERVVLNLSATEAKDLYWELNRQIDVAGEVGAYDLVPILDKLEAQLPKFIDAKRALDTDTEP